MKKSNKIKFFLTLLMINPLLINFFLKYLVEGFFWTYGAATYIMLVLTVTIGNLIMLWDLYKNS